MMPSLVLLKSVKGLRLLQSGFLDINSDLLSNALGDSC